MFSLYFVSFHDYDLRDDEEKINHGWICIKYILDISTVVGSNIVKPEKFFSLRPFFQPGWYFLVIYVLLEVYLYTFSHAQSMNLRIAKISSTPLVSDLWNLAQEMRHALELHFTSSIKISDHGKQYERIAQYK